MVADHREGDMDMQFTQIDNSVVRDASIPDDLLRTYLVIRSFAWESGGEMCTASLSTIGGMLDRGWRTVSDRISKLERLGLIDVQREPGRSLRIHAPRDVSSLRRTEEQLP